MNISNINVRICTELCLVLCNLFVGVHPDHQIVAHSLGLAAQPLFPRAGVYIVYSTRDEDPTFFSTDPDPAQLKKNSGSDLKSE